MTTRYRVWLPVVAVVVAALLPFVVDDYGADVIARMAIFALVAIGLSLLSGGTGQFSLGHAAFYAIGAFTAGILSASYGWPFWLDVPAGGLLAAAIGVALCVPTLRLSAPYLAIATLGFGLLVTEVLSTADWAQGRTGITLNPAQIGPYTLSTRAFYWLLLAVLVVGGLALHNLRRGATGRAFVALRESEPAAQASGINLARYRVIAFAISALCAGLGGAFYASLEGHISASSFDLPLSISFVVMIVVGGLDSTVGAVIGAIFVTGINEKLQDQPQLAAALYGVVLIVMLLFVPGGLMGLPRLARRWAGRLRAQPAEATRG